MLTGIGTRKRYRFEGENAEFDFIGVREDIKKEEHFRMREQPHKASRGKQLGLF